MGKVKKPVNSLFYIKNKYFVLYSISVSIPNKHFYDFIMIRFDADFNNS